MEPKALMVVRAQGHPAVTPQQSWCVKARQGSSPSPFHLCQAQSQAIPAGSACMQQPAALLIRAILTVHSTITWTTLWSTFTTGTAVPGPWAQGCQWGHCGKHTTKDS